MTWNANYTGVASGGGGQPEYFADIYGDATIGWVPPVTNYNYVENVPKRGSSNGTFRWEEVTIELEDVQSGAMLEFIVPDSYLIQLTPDLGWQDTLAMFGDNNDAGVSNPHLKSLGPYSINAGTLTDNGDGSVTATVSSTDFSNAATKGFADHLWRAVPFADGNPGLGGTPVRFIYISEDSQLDFIVDSIIKETKRPVQVITGKKSNRVTITVEEEDCPHILIEQNNTEWKVSFTIDRDRVRFKIVATDSGGTVGYHKVDITYDSFHQYSSHLWNSVDSFGLFASLTRLPQETNAKFKARIIDAFQYKGGAHYNGLIRGINRELGLTRFEEGLILSRTLALNSIPLEDEVTVIVTQTRLSINSNSLIIEDELVRVDGYDNILYTSRRINDVISIKNMQNKSLTERDWSLIEDEAGNAIAVPTAGIYKVTYQYTHDFLFASYPTLSTLIAGINTLTSPNGSSILTASLDKDLSGSETSDRLFIGYYISNITNPSINIGWSEVNLKSIADNEWKESFRDSKGMYFGSKFYRYAKELKSQTNVEWGSIVADENVWDAVGDQYGEAYLPLVYDICLSDYRLSVSIYNKMKFDPWEAYRMNFYYGGKMIKNVGFDKRLFLSGVGFTKDCVTSVRIENLSSKDKTINLNPHLVSPENIVDIDQSLINSIILDI